MEFSNLQLILFFFTAHTIQVLRLFSRAECLVQIARPLSPGAGAEVECNTEFERELQSPQPIANEVSSYS